MTGGSQFSAGQAYAAFSTVKSLQGLHILNFDPKAIKKSEPVENAMARLNTKLLPPMPQLQSLSLSSTHVTVSLLNVRSIVPTFNRIVTLRILVYSASEKHG